MSAFDFIMLVVQALGWCLVHFLWQAVLVGAAYALARWLLPRGNARYLAAMLGLAALAIIPVSTFWHEWKVLVSSVQLGSMWVTQAGGATTAITSAPAQAGWTALLRAALPWLVLAWACGVSFLGLRVARQWRQLRAIVRAAEALPMWQARAGQLGQRLGLRHAVRVLASVRIATPTLVGWVRPAVVMPLAMLARMPAAQVDWILAHELAHLRRLDHLANLFQVVLETLFFYHPVVHWISRDARDERELCCDALALQAGGGKRRDFVAALAGLEEFRAGHSDLALAASGGLLVERATFVAGLAPPRSRAPSHGIVLLAIVLGAALLLGLIVRHAAQQPDARPVTLPPTTRDAITAVPAMRGAAVAPERVPALVVKPPLPASDAGAALALPRTRIEVQPLQVPVPLVMRVRDMQAATPSLAGPLAAAIEQAPAADAAKPAIAGATLPVPLRVVAPDYPAPALENGTRGNVVVAFTLDADGHPHDINVVSARPAGVFDAAALAAIRQWRFAAPAAPGRRYRQAFNFAPANSGGRDVTAASEGCRYVTGSHICRDFSDASAVVQTRGGTGH